MALELNIINGTVSIPQEIENLEQLKSELAPKLDYYNTLVVTEDSIKEAKADKAKLNKLKTAVEDRRKDIKKQVMGLYEPLEKQCKELTALIDAPINAIDKQLKNFDEIKKQEKFETLKEHFENISKPAFIKLEDVLNPKWANATMKVNQIMSEMSEKISQMSEEYEVIKNLYENSPMLTAIKQRYEATKDKAQTLAYAALLERQYQREQEEQERKKTDAEISKPQEVDAESQEAPTEPQEPLMTGTFKVTCTKHQLINLRDYMRNIGIDFEIIK